ncbi:MAG: extracellular solute-binding protein [Cohnella sp.]|nr:extracellular solute-binding protein [Cohnella sp.]
MRKHKSFRLIVTLMLLALLAAGCGSGNNNNEQAQETAGSSSGASASAEQPAKEVTLTFWHHYSTASAEEKTLKEVLIPKFEAEHPNIRVNAVSFPWDQLHQKLQIGASAGELPDVARLDIIWVPELQANDMLVALDDKFDDFEEVSKGLLAGPLSTAVIGDRTYALPLNTNTKVMFWNEKMFKEAGLNQAPATMDEFFAALPKLKGKFPQSWGFGEPALRGWNVLPWLWSNGGDVLSPDNTTAQGYLNGAASVEIASKLQQAFTQGLIGGFKPGDTPVTEGHAKDVYGMMAEGPWAFAQFTDQFKDFKPMAASFLAGQGGSVQVLGGEDIGILSKEHPEESWEFVKFMVSEAAEVEMGKVGQIPVNLKAMENPDIKAISYFAPFLEQLKTSKARPPVSAWPQIDDVLNDAFMKIFLQKADVQKTLDGAAKQIDDLLHS